MVEAEIKIENRDGVQITEIIELLDVPDKVVELLATKWWPFTDEESALIDSSIRPIVKSFVEWLEQIEIWDEFEIDYIARIRKVS